jgi:molybdate transport system substrate-binding protein
VRRFLSISISLLVTFAFNFAFNSPITHATPPITITVSAAASLTDVLPVITKEFNKRHPHIAVRFNFAGSNALVEQLRAGAPVDVLATASVSSMASAVKNGWVNRPMVFSKNSMVIVTPRDNPAGITDISNLESPRVLTAVCAQSVPCGAAATKLFARNRVLVKPVSKELDVRGVLGKVIADQVDAGIVYLTDAKSAGKEVTSIIIPRNKNIVTSYLIAPVSYSRNPQAAKEFVDFIRYSSSSQRILRSMGFAKP